MASIPESPASSGQTPRKSWRRRKRERPDEIRHAALEEFALKGFASARMSDIARRAGVTKGTLYLYFSSKSDLFESVSRGLGGRAAREPLRL
jgi:AcrR family transcriptional regulator